MSGELLDITTEEYFALEAFSASRAKVVIARSAFHARYWAEKLPTKEMDIGTASHRFLLGTGKTIIPAPFEDWRTDAAKLTRKKARAEDKVALLHRDYTAAEELADTVRRLLRDAHMKDRRIPAELDGVSEQVMTWDEPTASGVVPCKGMMDHVWVERSRILDLKFVDDASPVATERAAENLGHGIQWAAYRSGLAKLRPGTRVEFLFLFVEMHAPHAIRIVEPDGMFRELGSRRWSRAVETWGRCLATGEWPAYGDGIQKIGAPSWALHREGYTTHEGD